MISIDKNYYLWLDKLPLIPIRNKKHLAVANKVIVDLAMKGPARSAGETEYLSVLSGLIADYESKEFAHLRTKMTQGEIVESLLEASGLSQSQLGKIIQISQARFSDVINGRRALSKAQIIRLCQYFNLSADLFLLTANAA